MLSLILYLLNLPFTRINKDFSRAPYHDDYINSPRQAGHILRDNAADFFTVVGVFQSYKQSRYICFS